MKPESKPVAATSNGHRLVHLLLPTNSKLTTTQALECKFRQFSPASECALSRVISLPLSLSHLFPSQLFRCPPPLRPPPGAHQPVHLAMATTTGAPSFINFYLLPAVVCRPSTTPETPRRIPGVVFRLGGMFLTLTLLCCDSPRIEQV